MSERNFMKMLEARWAKGNFVCVGLDSQLDKIPDSLKHGLSDFDAVALFNKMIVLATSEFVCAYKPNFAFYASLGSDGLAVLEETIVCIHRVAPEVPVILDAKVADIGNTNNGYVKMVFEYLKADAITVHPYLGQEALKPFLDLPNKGVIVLCRTSNPGAGEFQDLPVALGDGHVTRPFYQVLANQVAKSWNRNNNCALVVGATYPSELAEVRQIVGDMPILIPGIGAQGGDVEATVKAGQDSKGEGMIVNSSRGIIFASSGEDFKEAARREAEKLHDMINQFRKQPKEA